MGFSGRDAGVSGSDGGVSCPDVGFSGRDARVSGSDASRTGVVDDDEDDSINNFSPEVVKAIEGVKFIAEHLKREDEARYVSSMPNRFLVISAK